MPNFTLVGEKKNQTKQFLHLDCISVNCQFVWTSIFFFSHFLRMWLKPQRSKYISCGAPGMSEESPELKAVSPSVSHLNPYLHVNVIIAAWKRKLQITWRVFKCQRINSRQNAGFYLLNFTVWTVLFVPSGLFYFEVPE